MNSREAREVEQLAKLMGDLGQLGGAIAVYKARIEELTRERDDAYARGFKDGQLSAKEFDRG